MTEDDANDVVQLLQESLLEVFTSESGEVMNGGKGGKGGSLSLSKQVRFKRLNVRTNLHITSAAQVKALVKVLTQESQRRDSAMFTRNEIAEVCEKLRLDRDVDSLVEVMRTECYLLLKGPRLYQLQTV